MQPTRCLSARVDRALRRQCFYPKEQQTQHGVKALDGGDADAADAVELRGLIDSLPRIAPLGFPSVSHRFPLAPLQVLDVVKLGELAAVVGRDRSPFRARGWVDCPLEY